MVKVSVIVPVYNEEKYLERCLDSICSQTLREIEIICVDDGSTDQSLQILESFAKKDSRIKILAQKNQFAGTARNHGMEYATGEYLSFLDADDYFKEDMLEKMYQNAMQSSSDIVICRYAEYCENTGKTKNVDWTYADSFLETKTEFSGSLLKHAGIFQVTKGWTWDKLFRTEFVEQCGYKFPGFRSSEDGFFVFMLLARAQKISYIDNIFVIHRVNNKNSLSRTMERNWLNGFKMLLLIKEELERSCLYEVFQQSFLNEVVEFVVWYIHSMHTLEAFKKCYLYTQMVIESEVEVLKYESDYYYRNDLYNCYKKIVECPLEEYLFQRYDENIRMIDKQREVISAYSVRLSERGWIFPYHIVEKGKTIVLYGAGKIGKCYYSQLIDSQYCKEVIWVDQRYEEYVALGEPVRSVEIISTLEFDYVFLAIKDSEVQKQIKGWLLKKGVCSEQIRCYEDSKTSIS